MSKASTTSLSSSYVHHYRPGRRWIPKGVALLAVLFLVGLLSACQKAPSTLDAAIAVPNDRALAEVVDRPCGSEAVEKMYAVTYQTLEDAPRRVAPGSESAGLNVF